LLAEGSFPPTRAPWPTTCIFSSMFCGPSPQICPKCHQQLFAHEGQQKNADAQTRKKCWPKIRYRIAESDHLQ
jgi:hypothetical protein